MGGGGDIVEMAPPGALAKQHKQSLNGTGKGHFVKWIGGCKTSG